MEFTGRTTPIETATTTLKARVQPTEAHPLEEARPLELRTGEVSLLLSRITRPSSNITRTTTEVSSLKDPYPFIGGKSKETPA
jgi:hypothetical protein